jgi:D-aspartate ligase
LKIFILHTRRTGYGVIRSLAGTPCAIYGADTIRSEASYSKYLKEFFLIPEITACSESEFLALLVSLAEKMRYTEEKPVVFTGKDDYLLFFAKHHEVLSRYFRPSFETDYATLIQALDKAALAKVAKDNGVLTPRRFELSDFEPPAANIPFPVIIKPAIKNRPEIDVVNKAFRIHLCRNLDELKNAAQALEKLGQPYVIQEYIPGGDDALFTCGVYCHQGKLMAWSTSRKIRQFPSQTGECSLGETVHLPALVEPSKKLIRAIGLSGILQIEYKKCGDKFYLIEINPRIWSWHEIHRFVGVNLVTIAINYVLGLDPHDRVVMPARTRKTWMFLSMDMLHNAILNRKVSLAKSLLNCLQADAEAFFNIRDPKPFLMHWKNTIPYMRSVIKKQRQSK